MTTRGLLPQERWELLGISGWGRPDQARNFSLDAPPDGDGTRYAHPNYRVYPRRGTALLRFATVDGNFKLDGGLDEVAIFDRSLAAFEISQLYSYAIDDLDVMAVKTPD